MNILKSFQESQRKLEQVEAEFRSLQWEVQEGGGGAGGAGSYIQL